MGKFLLLSSAVKIVQGGDNIRNAYMEVPDINFEPRIAYCYIFYIRKVVTSIKEDRLPDWPLTRPT